MKKNRVYTAIFSRTCAPAANADISFRIDNFNRTCVLKSIIMDLNIVKTPAPFLPLNINTQVTQYYNLAVFGTVVGELIGQSFENIVPAAAINANGTEIDFYRPGQKIFNSLFINNQMNFMFTYLNLDAAISYMYFLSVTAEIEDIPLKYAL